MRDVLFSMAWLFLLPASLISAHIGVLLWIWVALLPPANMLYTSLGSIPYNKIVAASVVFMAFAGGKKKDFYFDNLMGVIMAYTVVTTLSYFLAEFPGGGADLQFDKFWKEIVLYVLLTGIMYSRHRIHQATLVTGVAFAFIMVKEGALFFLSAGGHLVEPIGTVGDNNGVALALLMTMPLLLVCAKHTELHWVRMVMWVTVALGCVAVIATNSRGGFVGLVVFGLMLMKGSKYKVRAIVALCVLAVALYAVMPQEYIDRISTIKQASSDNSFEIRLLSWKINTLLALDHPLLGAGLYASTSIPNWFGKIGEAQNWLFHSPDVPITFVAHSIYFQVLGDTGFLGLGLFLTMLGLAFAKTLQTQRLARRDPALEWAGDVARALQVSLVCYCVSGAALSLVYFELLYIVLALVSRTHRTARQLAVKETRRSEFTQPKLVPAFGRAA